MLPSPLNPADNPNPNRASNPNHASDKIQKYKRGGVGVFIIFIFIFPISG